MVLTELIPQYPIRVAIRKSSYSDLMKVTTFLSKDVANYFEDTFLFLTYQ